MRPVLRSASRKPTTARAAGRPVPLPRSLLRRFPTIAAQWHPTKNRGVGPGDVWARGAFPAWWKCPVEVDHVWRASVNERTDPRGPRGCPFCSGRRPSTTTSLAAVNPDLAREWHRTLNKGTTPRDVRPGSNFAAWWSCASGHTWRSRVSRRALAPFSGCPHCARIARKKSPPSKVRAVTVRRVFGHARKEKSLIRSLPPPRSTGRLAVALDRHGLVTEIRLATLLGIDIYRLRLHLDQNDVAPERVANDRRWYRWRDLVAPLQGKADAASNSKPWRETLLGIRLSKRWVAGYPRLVAEWHPEKNGDLFPFQVSYGSGKAIWWKCPGGPDHEWRARPGTRVPLRNGGTNCPFCASHRASVTNSVATLRPDLAKQWDCERTGFGPEEVTLGTRVEVWWRCDAGPDHLWKARLNSRVYAGQGCPSCAHVQLSVTNCLASVAPHLAKEWHPAKNRKTAFDVFSRSRTKVWWRCSKDPRHAWRASPASRMAAASCPFCAAKGARAAK